MLKRPYGMLSKIFGSKKDSTLLKVHLDERKVCVIQRAPEERKFSVRLEWGSPVLRFTDSAGKEYAHSLESVLDKGPVWMHVSVRVSEKFACQSDCLITNSSTPSKTEFREGKAYGIRFQPFILPEDHADPEPLAGRGLMSRGFHFPGVVTPGNVRSSCICDCCSKSFILDSFHAGFSDSAYFYCSSGPHTLIVNAYRDKQVPYFPPAKGEPDWEMLARLEEDLPKCERCGGDFKYLNPFLCPHCLKPYIDYTKNPKERESDYYGVFIHKTLCQTLKSASDGG